MPAGSQSGLSTRIVQLPPSPSAPGAGSADVQGVLDEVVRTVLVMTGAAGVTIMGYDSVEDDLALQAGAGLPRSFPEALGRIKRGEGACGAVLETAEPFLCGDVETHPRCAAHLRAYRLAGYRSVYSWPLLTAKERMVGTLALYYPEPRTPAPRDVDVVHSYARQAAETIERARLHEESRLLAVLERQRASQLRALADAAVELGATSSLPELLRTAADRALEIIGAHQAAASYVPDGDLTRAETAVALTEKYADLRDYDQVPVGSEISVDVLRTGRPICLSQKELEAHPGWRGFTGSGEPLVPLNGYLAVPLVDRDGAGIGIVHLSDKDDGPFTAEDEAMLVQLAQMTSVVIENVLLVARERAARARAEERAGQRDLLAEASRAFSETLNPDETVEAILGFAVPGLADWASLHEVDERGRVALRNWRAARPELTSPLGQILETFPVSLDQPYGAGSVLRSGRTAVYPEITDEMIDRMARAGNVPVEDMRALRLRSGVAIPLTVRGRTIAALSLARVHGSRKPAFGDEEVELLEDLGGRAALALDTATRYQFERRAAGTLQRSLLPLALPITRGAAAAARYLPGFSGAEVGGDWYDLIELDEDRLGLAVGDVMGRGIAAAAIMGQVRAALRAYALDIPEPADVLTRLDWFVQTLDETQLTTCVYGVLHQRTNTLVVASAGHLPPLVIEPGHDPMFLDLEPGLPLGVGGSAYQQSTLQLPATATVLLYTDGLVEGPDCPVDVGLQRLRDAVSSPVIDPEEFCDEVLVALGRDGHHDDDTALLALTLTTVDTSPGVRSLGPSMLELERHPQSAGVARAFVAETLSAAGLRHQAFIVGLLTSELVTNALRHADGELRLELAVRDGSLRVDVSDGSRAVPELRPPADSGDEHGRGLLLVDALADRWGSEALASGKRVWFEVGLLSELG